MSHTSQNGFLMVILKLLVLRGSIYCYCTVVAPLGTFSTVEGVHLGKGIGEFREHASFCNHDVCPNFKQNMYIRELQCMAKNVIQTDFMTKYSILLKNNENFNTRSNEIIV